MSKEKNGGPAFPQSGVCTPEIESWDSDDFGGRGLSIRDYFAAKCMAAVISSPNGPVIGEECPGGFDYYAECAYKMSDAMLRAREAS